MLGSLKLYSFCMYLQNFHSEIHSLLRHQRADGRLGWIMVSLHSGLETSKATSMPPPLSSWKRIPSFFPSLNPIKEVWPLPVLMPLAFSDWTISAVRPGHSPTRRIIALPILEPWTEKNIYVYTGNWWQTDNFWNLEPKGKKPGKANHTPPSSIFNTVESLPP